MKSFGKVSPNDPPEDDGNPVSRFGGQRGGGAGRGPRGQNATNFRNLSPDKKAYVYAQDENLYYAEVSAEDKPVQLTKDGVKDYGYGSAAADAKEKRVRVNAVWSPDSKSFAIERRDSRKVKDLYLVNSLNSGRISRCSISIGWKHRITFASPDEIAFSEILSCATST